MQRGALSDLNTFLLVAEHLSFRAAAERLLRGRQRSPSSARPHILPVGGHRARPTISARTAAFNIDWEQRARL
jgi:hypothetical protein